MIGSASQTGGVDGGRTPEFKRVLAEYTYYELCIENDNITAPQLAQMYANLINYINQNKVKFTHKEREILEELPRKFETGYIHPILHQQSIEMLGERAQQYEHSNQKQMAVDCKRAIESLNKLEKTLRRIADQKASLVQQQPFQSGVTSATPQIPPDYSQYRDACVLHAFENPLIYNLFLSRNSGSMFGDARNLKKMQEAKPPTMGLLSEEDAKKLEPTRTLKEQDQSVQKQYDADRTLDTLKRWMLKECSKIMSKERSERTTAEEAIARVYNQAQSNPAMLADLFKHLDDKAELEAKNIRSEKSKGGPKVDTVTHYKNPSSKFKQGNSIMSYHVTT